MPDIFPAQLHDMLYITILGGRFGLGMMPLTANLGAACADKHALRADAHLALVAAGQEEHCDAQDVIWRQSEGVWGVSLRMHGRMLSVLTCGGNSQHENLQNLLSQPYCVSRYRAW